LKKTSSSSGFKRGTRIDFENKIMQPLSRRRFVKKVVSFFQLGVCTQHTFAKIGTAVPGSSA
jgi:hypothetical protein